MLGFACMALPSFAADQKPNILLIVSDDTGYGDLGPYGGGVGRGMPTPNIAAELHTGPRRHADGTHS